MITLFAGGERELGQTDEAQAALFRSMIAYTGKCRVENDEFTTTVDVSWNGIFTGTEQRRFYKLDGDRLDIVTAWLAHPAYPERGMARGILTWERER